MIKIDENGLKYINYNISENVQKLLLKNQDSITLPYKVLIHQIASRQKVKEKLPEWVNNLNICFPQSISLEQASSQKTAAFKSNLFSGKTLIDLTGGLGIDFWLMSQKFEKAIYIEKNSELCEVAQHNFDILSCKNIEILNTDAEQYIAKLDKIADLIYIDPARRNENGGKVFMLSDCVPNVVALKEVLITKSENVLIKTSPMLDIDLAINQLEHVHKVFIISIENEVKELLFHLKNTRILDPQIECINIQGDGVSRFNFTKLVEKDIVVKIGPIQKYLYEPNASILKAGAFKSISEKFQIEKLNNNTHLYSSNVLLSDFPGRVFEIKHILKPNKKELIKFLPDLKANLSNRNFPDSVLALKQKLGLKDGGEIYIFGFTDHLNVKKIILTTKIF